jgi:hypothetical protein
LFAGADVIGPWHEIAILTATSRSGSIELPMSNASTFFKLSLNEPGLLAEWEILCPKKIEIPLAVRIPTNYSKIVSGLPLTLSNLAQNDGRNSGLYAHGWQ